MSKQVSRIYLKKNTNLTIVGMKAQNYFISKLAKYKVPIDLICVLLFALGIFLFVSHELEWGGIENLYYSLVLLPFMLFSFLLMIRCYLEKFMGFFGVFRVFFSYLTPFLILLALKFDNFLPSDKYWFLVGGGPLLISLIVMFHGFYVERKKLNPLFSI
jgi:hypothetical protein